MPQTLTRSAKGCDASCVGAECNHPTCHEGDPDNVLVECEECERDFCVSHVNDEGAFYLCADCKAKQVCSNCENGKVRYHCAECGQGLCDGMSRGFQRGDKGYSGNCTRVMQDGTRVCHSCQSGLQAQGVL